MILNYLKISPLLILLIASPAFSAVTLDAVSTGNSNEGGTSSVTDSITVGAISDGLLICGVGGQSNTVAISSASFGASSMNVSIAPITHSILGISAFIIYLKAPAAGADTVTVYWTEDVNSTIACVSLAGVDQSTPIGTPSSTNNAEALDISASTLTLSLPTDGMIFDAIVNRSYAALSPTGNNTERREVSTAGGGMGEAISTNATDGTNSWSIDSPEGAVQLAVAVNAASGVAPIARRRPIIIQ